MLLEAAGWGVVVAALARGAATGSGAGGSADGLFLLRSNITRHLIAYGVRNRSRAAGNGEAALMGYSDLSAKMDLTL